MRPKPLMPSFTGASGFEDLSRGHVESEVVSTAHARGCHHSACPERGERIRVEGVSAHA